MGAFFQDLTPEIKVTVAENSERHYMALTYIHKLNLGVNTRVIFYVRRIGLYLYKYRIYGTISIYILKDLASLYQLI